MIRKDVESRNIGWKIDLRNALIHEKALNLLARHYGNTLEYQIIKKTNCHPLAFIRWVKQKDR